ncbi:DUF2333 family protein [Ferrimonas balearica]|uniref:DUF2333 family protein n=1 Tax=Ferrimonas balearica TaxID=44012 RepID=UPI001C9983F5|nr:DUF2333 family protein [Ferrimonas balearica]MBY5923426.1 DUF2333 family protein [Ferrimonas balearica]MBY5995176.1 DUF2333 family protein [Ferrimonas balearica]
MVAVNKKWLGIGLVAVVLLNYLIAVWWSVEPDPISLDSMRPQEGQPVVGYATTTAVIEVASTLLDKPGGFLSNDVMPPSVMMDNMPSFEFGALEQLRDISLVMRREFSRSQSQSAENKDLQIAQPKFNIDHRSWMMPRAESEYRDAIKALERYRAAIMDPTNEDAQFYARADNLVSYLDEVGKRLGSLSQRLAASVGQERLNTNLAGDSEARQSTGASGSAMVRTSWWQIDNVFYEARGHTWALLAFMTAIEEDFGPVLDKKNARVSLQQIIRELEATQETVWSPMILNGSGFGLVANHSLVMANYISRANAALIDLKQLLTQG